MTLTLDAFLDGRVMVSQPGKGYRAATDPVLLAAACPAAPGQRVLDAGAGVGVASWCLAARVEGLALHGLELQPAYAQLSRENAARQGVGWTAHEGSITSQPASLRALSFDHVITNPPYFAAGAAQASPEAARDLANRETVPLRDWLEGCLRRLRPGGVLTIIHRVERLAEIITALSGPAGDLRLLALHARPATPAKRVLVRATKGSAAPPQLLPGMILHHGDGTFTAEAEAVLRDGGHLMMGI